MLKASIIGATGYTGIELIRILSRHPKVEIQDLVSSSKSGKKLGTVYPHFVQKGDIQLKEYEAINKKETDIFFAALPHGISQEFVADIYHQGQKVVDLSGDFRYKRKDIYEKWYEKEHKFPELLSEAVYGLVEVNKEQIEGAVLVANPGCYPTASLLGILPILSEEIIDRNSIIIDAKSGVSGAGKSLKKVTHFIEANESIKAYGITTHRHTSEIESGLNNFIEENNIDEKIQVSFTPHLTPMKRGILATIYIDLLNNIKNDAIDTERLNNIYKKYYSNSKFVHILKDSNPDTKLVAGSNYCQIGVDVDSRNSRIIITSAIDNLVKGAAGQAVQNMNIMFDLPEELGLEDSAIFP